MPKKPPRAFDKYFYYLHAVQDPRGNMAFLHDIYLEQRGVRPSPFVLREDFCGTFANACAWVVRGPDYIAHGIDIDPEPIVYGRERQLRYLRPEQRARVHICEGDVLEAPLAEADVVAALNYAATFFDSRRTLSAYAARVLASLRDGGLVVFDLYGGPYYEAEHCEHVVELEAPERFTYTFEGSGFDPLTRVVSFAIHFKRPGEARRRDVFTYRMRIWTPPELREVLLDCGFRDVRFYWENSAPDGAGDGTFVDAERGEACDNWNVYVVGLK